WNGLLDNPSEPLRRRPGSFDNSLLVEPNPIHPNSHTCVVHDSDHPGADSLKPLTQALEIEGFLKTRNLENNAAIKEELVNVPLLSLRVRQADAKMLSVDAGKSPHVCLPLARDDANMLLQKVGEFFHELAAGSRRQLGYLRSASGTSYIIFGPTHLAEPSLRKLSSSPRANPSPSVSP